MSRRWLSLTLMLMMALALAGGSGLEAQDPPQDPIADEEPAPAAEGVDSDNLLADEESMFLGEGYVYEPGDRRDPFKSLLVVRERLALRGPRPDGIPGLLIEEIDLNGIFVTADGPVAQVRSTQEDKSYLLREGDQLYDGDVVSITVSEISFKQIVDDPTAVKPFREVVKKLNQ